MIAKTLHRTATLLLLALLPLLGVAQGDFQLESINARSFPAVELNVRTGGTGTPTAADFEVTENGQPVTAITVTEGAASGGDASGPTAVFILIEASGHTYGTASANMKKAITDVLVNSDIGTDTPVNIGYFGRAGSGGTALNLLSAEFTTDHSAFVAMVNDRITAPRDTTYRSDVFKSIYEALEYIANKPNLPARRMLLVVSAAINNSSSTISHTDCARLAKEKGIAVFGLGYATGNRYAADNLVLLSEQTGGKFTRASNAEEAQRGVRDLLAQGITGPSGGGSTPGSFILKYTSSIEAGTAEVQVSVKYKNQRVTGNYSATGTEGAAAEGGFMKKYGMYLILGGLVLLVGIGGLIMMQSNKKKKAAAEAAATAEATQRNAQAQAQADQVARMEAENRRLADEVRRKEQEAAAQMAAQANAQQNQKLDLKRTMISPSAGGGTPMLSVQAPGFSHNFPLAKAQTNIGRAEGNEIQIPEQTVSSRHAVIINEGGQLYIEDIGSTNGTLLNGMRVQGRHSLKHGDLVQLGNATLKLL